MSRIETASGFVCEVDESRLDDMELLENIVALDKGDVLVLPDTLTRLLGAEGKKALYDQVRKDGRVPMEAVSTELEEIFRGLKEGKK